MTGRIRENLYDRKLLQQKLEHLQVRLAPVGLLRLHWIAAASLSCFCKTVVCCGSINRTAHSAALQWDGSRTMLLLGARTQCMPLDHSWDGRQCVGQFLEG